MKKSKNDNEILVEFEFLIDLDIALFRLIKDKYINSNYVDKDIISIKNKNEILNMLLYRNHINPLEVIMPNVETTKLYDEINNNEELLLKYASPHDTLFLMITFLNNASSLGITIWCKNQLEADYIKKINNKFNIIIVENRHSIDISKYTAIYMKFFIHSIEYNNLAGKYIYIANANYNFDDNKNIINPNIGILVGDVNIIKTIDLYTDVKFNIIDKGDNNDEDLLEYSPRAESEGNTEGDAWYNF